MDIFLKIVQIGFYITASTVAILTYLKAKNGLLNTVNTEYQKRVIDRLAELSAELFDEFDNKSENYWLLEDSVKEALDQLHEEVTPHKHEIITKDWDIPGIPVPNKVSKLNASLSQIKSDPFIPSDIRNKTVDFIDTNHQWLHNKIIYHLSDSGYGIPDLESKVNEIRTDMQTYFEGFNPIKKD